MAKKNKRSKNSRPGGNRSFSTLSQHVLEGKTLRPPFRKLDKVTLTSWQDDHLPSMIWASLLTETLPRRDYLDCFRKLISHCGPWFADGGLLDRRALAPAKGDQINFS